MSELSDEQIIHLINNGDEDAFGILYRRHFNLLKLFISSRFKLSIYESEDIAQKAFLKAYKSISNFRGESSFKTWLYKIARNVSIDFLKKPYKDKEIAIQSELEVENFFSNISTQENPSSCLEEKDENKNLASLIKKVRGNLSKEQNRLFELYFIKQNSYKELSKKINVPIGTVMSRLFYLRKKVKPILEEELNGSTSV